MPGAACVCVPCVWSVCWGNRTREQGQEQAMLLPSQGDLLLACFLESSFSFSNTNPPHIPNTGMGVSPRAWRPNLASFFLLLLVLLFSSTDGFGPQHLSPLRVPLNAVSGQSKHAHTAKATSRRRATSSSWALQVRLPKLFLCPSTPPASPAG